MKGNAGIRDCLVGLACRILLSMVFFFPIAFGFMEFCGSQEREKLGRSEVDASCVIWIKVSDCLKEHAS